MIHTFKCPWGDMPIKSGEVLDEAEIRPWDSECGCWGPWEQALLLRGYSEEGEEGSDDSIGWYTVEWGHRVVEGGGRYEVRPISTAPTSGMPSSQASEIFQDGARRALGVAVAMLGLGAPLDGALKEVLNASLYIDIQKTDHGYTVSTPEVVFQDGRSIGGLFKEVSEESVDSAVGEMALHLLWMLWQVRLTRRVDDSLSKLRWRVVGRASRALRRMRAKTLGGACE